METWDVKLMYWWNTTTTFENTDFNQLSQNSHLAVNAARLENLSGDLCWSVFLIYILEIVIISPVTRKELILYITPRPLSLNLKVH